MPRWECCLEWSQLLHPSWRFTSVQCETTDEPFNSICSSVLCEPCSRMNSSIQFSCVHSHAPLGHQSNVSICFLKCHFTLSHFRIFPLSLHIYSFYPLIHQHMSSAIKSHFQHTEKNKKQGHKGYITICRPTTEIFRKESYSSLSSLLISLTCYTTYQMVMYSFVHYFHNGGLWWERPDTLTSKTFISKLW